MPTPAEHAVCSASASERWLNCTAAPRYEEQFPESSSVYGEEGRLAHSFCELYGRKRFTVMSKGDFDAELAKLQADPLYNPEMLGTAQSYTDFLNESALSYDEKPYIAFEVRVDFSDIVPEGFGTCDCVMVGGHVMRITDYKHGKGVPVSAVDNSQMRLYALGCLKKYNAIFGNTITDVYTAIVQPRINDDVEVEHLTVAELEAWGEHAKPIAQRAFTGFGAEFVPGDWCRFCRGKAVCKARADKYSAFNDFKDAFPTSVVVEGDGSSVPVTKSVQMVNNALTDEKIGELLAMSAGLKKWVEDLEEYAMEALLSGRKIPGYKLVAGRSTRTFTDEKKVLSTLTRKLKIKTADCYKPRELKSPAMLEKMLGKKPFNEALGRFVEKPMGKPTLVPESDKREAYSPAVADFEDAVK